MLEKRKMKNKDKYTSRVYGGTLYHCHILHVCVCVCVCVILLFYITYTFSLPHKKLLFFVFFFGVCACWLPNCQWEGITFS